MECLKCGTCCTAPDITALGKQLGVRCRHLDENNLCVIYEERPAVCRGYKADWICREISAPTLAERVGKYLTLFDLQGQTQETQAVVRERGGAGPPPKFCGSFSGRKHRFPIRRKSNG